MPNINSHYVPQRFLRNFAVKDDSGMIWRYEKGTGIVKLLPIKRVAQSVDFYTEENERWLSESIEGPTWHPLDLLLQEKSITPSQRLQIANFLAVSHGRGPALREWILNPLPELKPDIIAGFLSDPSLWISNKHPTAKDVVEAVQSWQDTDGPAPFAPNHPALTQFRIDPWLTMVINQMAWEIVDLGRSRLICGDNPVTVDLGIDPFHPEPELTIVLSPQKYLFAYWHKEQAGKHSYLQKVDGEETVVEINRRAISWATRYIFADERFLFYSTMPELTTPWKVLAPVNGQGAVGKLFPPPHFTKRSFEKTMWKIPEANTTV